MHLVDLLHLTTRGQSRRVKALWQAVWQHILDSLLSHARFPEPEARYVGGLGSLLYVTSNDLCWSETVSSSAQCTQKEPPGLVSKNNVFFVSKNPWYVLAGNSKNSAFSPCPPKPNFTPTAHYFSSLHPSHSLLFIASPWHFSRSRNYASLTSSLSWLECFFPKKKWGICLFVLRSESGIKMQTQ